MRTYLLLDSEIWQLVFSDKGKELEFSCTKCLPVTALSVFPLACLSIYLPTYLPTYILSYIPIYLPSYLLTYTNIYVDYPKHL